MKRRRNGPKRRREDGPGLIPDDIAWVTEWQLASGFRWVPLEVQAAVEPDLMAEPDGKKWGVALRVGGARVRVRLPMRDLSRVIDWCYEAATPLDLARPPAPVRASLFALRAALRAALRSLDPLGRMGYLSVTRESDA